LNAQNIYLIGFDGYAKAIMDEKAQELFAENSYLFNTFQEASGIQPVSLVDTSYPVRSLSIFSLL